MAKAKPSTGKDLVKWDEELAKYAQASADREKNQAGGKFLSIKGGVLKFNDQPIKGGIIDVVVVAATCTKARYEGDFDPNDPQPPICYAFGLDETELTPHADAPEKQSEACKTCEWNKFGTAERGRGKGCKDGRRLALIHADNLKDPAKIDKAEIVYLAVPPTSLKGFAAYVKSVTGALKRPEWSVVTRIEVQPDEDRQVSVGFDLVEKVDNAALSQLKALHDRAQDEIGFPYLASASDGDAKPKTRGGARSKAKPIAKKKAAGKF